MHYIFRRSIDNKVALEITLRTKKEIIVEACYRLCSEVNVYSLPVRTHITLDCIGKCNLLNALKYSSRTLFF